jgi:hypothetical protein
MKKELEEIFDVLDEYLGDTDPNIPDDMNDEEVKEEYPILWVTQQISKLIDGLKE